MADFDRLQRGAQTSWALLACFGSVIAFAGCATKYQDMGFTGGVAAQQMTANTFRIVARGNGYTARTTVQDYMMLKAAETTKQNGGTHFIVISAADASSIQTHVSSGYAQTSLVGNRAYTTYSPPTATNIFKPGEDAYIRVFNVPNGTEAPPGGVPADEIIRFVGSRVARPDS